MKLFKIGLSVAVIGCLSGGAAYAVMEYVQSEPTPTATYRRLSQPAAAQSALQKAMQGTTSPTPTPSPSKSPSPSPSSSSRSNTRTPTPSTAPAPSATITPSTTPTPITPTPTPTTEPTPTQPSEPEE